MSVDYGNMWVTCDGCKRVFYLDTCMTIAGYDESGDMKDYCADCRNKLGIDVCAGNCLRLLPITDLKADGVCEICLTANLMFGFEPMNDANDSKPILSEDYKTLNYEDFDIS